jgi:hypothetical protein
MVVDGKTTIPEIRSDADRMKRVVLGRRQTSRYGAPTAGKSRVGTLRRLH